MSDLPDRARERIETAKARLLAGENPDAVLEALVAAGVCVTCGASTVCLRCEAKRLGRERLLPWVLRQLGILP